MSRLERFHIGENRNRSGIFCIVGSSLFLKMLQKPRRVTGLFFEPKNA
jgi:hypothetical protein